MITDDIESMYRRTKWSLVLRGLVGVAVGTFILMRPVDGVAVFALVIAFWALVDGFSSIAYAFELRPISSHWYVLLLSGLVSALFGVAALYYYPALSLSFAVVWTALWLFTGGALGVYIALQERTVGMSWGWTLTLGLLAIVASGVAVMYPGITLGALIGVIGGYAIAAGIVRLALTSKLQSFGQRVKRGVGTPAGA